MISGQTDPGHHRPGTDQARAKGAAVEAQIETVNAEARRARNAQAQDYSELARLRVDLARRRDPGPAPGPDRAASHRHSWPSARRRWTDLHARSRLPAETARQTLESERAAQAGQADAAAQAVDAAEARTQARLDAEPAYQAQRERAPGGRAHRRPRRRRRPAAARRSGSRRAPPTGPIHSSCTCGTASTVCPVTRPAD